MSRNEAGWDRALRALLGAGLVGASLTGAVGPWGWIGVLPLLTAAIGWCPLYTVLGINTCRIGR